MIKNEHANDQRRRGMKKKQQQQQNQHRTAEDPLQLIRIEKQKQKRTKRNEKKNRNEKQTITTAIKYCESSVSSAVFFSLHCVNIDCVWT